MYQDNQGTCDALFSGGGITKPPLEFMLDNKAESVLRLVDNFSNDLIVPEYIIVAIAWINA